MMEAIRPGDGTAEDDALMLQGTHYDYVAQKWVDGHDHAHFEHDKGPLSFCGSDAVTCREGHPEMW